MSDFVKCLIDMGFDPEKSKKAVDVTGNSSVESAMEWILSQPEDERKEDTSTEPQTEKPKETSEANSDEATTSATDTTVRSYKCDDCGKQFKDESEMEYHAAKTQHSNFSESNMEKKPLTTEERAAQLKLIELKLKEKRAEREAKEKEESLQREKMRIQSGKDILEAKRRFDEQQMKEIADARRREKLEEKAARERVKAQIEADKAARRAKQAELTEPQAKSANLPSSPPSSSQLPTSNSVSKTEYTQTKIQMKLPSGKALVQTFGVQEPLAAVRLYIQLNRNDGHTESFNLMSTFPRKVYQGEDFDKPLSALGLVPSAVLMVVRDSAST